MRKTLLSTLAVAVWLGTSLLCPAQDAPKNLVTVAFSGYDRMAADIDYVAKLIGNAAIFSGISLSGFWSITVII